ncbi:MAG: LysR family transcriptional regulator [Proteobacteria bacterium]|nr:LysR family transcriptional regulator [Pseudomonadota bacterium]
MDLRHLRYFVAVAETLNFGRAAARLSIAQPPLSRAVAALEAELGASLFARTTRGVRLTPVGAALLPEARRLLRDADALREGARHLADGDVGTLAVGFVSMSVFGVLPDIVQAFHRARPGVTLTLRESMSDAMPGALRSGELDVGLALPGPADVTVDYSPLTWEPLVAALPATRRWPARVGLASLAAEPFLLFPRAAGAWLYDAIVGFCRRAGFAPRIDQEAVQMQTIVSLVAAGMGVALVPASLHRMRRTGVVYRPLVEKSPAVEVGLVQRARDDSPLVQAFVADARTVARTYAGSEATATPRPESR